MACAVCILVPVVTDKLYSGDERHIRSEPEARCPGIAWQAGSLSWCPHSAPDGRAVTANVCGDLKKSMAPSWARVLEIQPPGRLRARWA